MPLPNCVHCNQTLAMYPLAIYRLLWVTCDPYRRRLRLPLIFVFTKNARCQISLYELYAFVKSHTLYTEYSVYFYMPLIEFYQFCIFSNLRIIMWSSALLLLLLSFIICVPNNRAPYIVFD